MSHILFICSNCSKSGLYWTLTAHLNSNTKFSSEILDLCLDFIKFTVEKVNSHNQGIPGIHKSFPITELSISFSISISIN